MSLSNSVMENPKSPGATGEFSLPEWETTPRHRGEKQQKAAAETFKESLLDHLNRLMPAHRKYLGLSRKVACIIIAVVVAAILVLIIGLAAGLSHRSSDHKSLPLGSQTYTGDLTYYDPALGACGATSSDNDNIVSISHTVFDAVSKGSDPNANPLCGHKLRVVLNGKSLDLKVVDRCVGCKPTDLDVTPGAFKRLANPDLGRVVMSWAWLAPVPNT
ncbi:hypothetical protein ACLMJK_005728 [Lecanora helva]